MPVLVAIRLDVDLVAIGQSASGDRSVTHCPGRGENLHRGCDRLVGELLVTDRHLYMCHCPSGIGHRADLLQRPGQQDRKHPLLSCGDTVS